MEEKRTKHHPTFEQAALAQLSKTLKGQLILPADPEYDTARRVWNGFFDKYPAAIARCADTQDVIIAVNFARDQQAKLVVRGGGHDYAGNGTADDGFVIDLARMNGVAVDPQTRIARVQGGACWGAFDASAQQWGLATTGGTVSSIGVGGLTLGGGTGYLARKHGLTLDNLLSVEMVTAEGKLVRADKEENKDLFWAIRGGGGNFGIVTLFEYRLHAVGPEVLTAQLFYPYENSQDVLRFYRQFMAAAPDELQCYAFIMHTPPVAPFPAAYHGKTAIALIACYAGELEAGKEILNKLCQFGKPFLTIHQPIAYTVLQQSFDAGMPKGLRWYSKAHHLAELSDGVIDTICEHTRPLPGAYSMVYLEALGGAIRRVKPAETAYRQRMAAYALHLLPGWEDARQDEMILSWAKRFYQALENSATGGVYINLLGHDEKERIRAVYGENYARLARLKKAWDPANMFASNHNILAAD